jgi:hypothetical protein
MVEQRGEYEELDGNGIFNKEIIQRNKRKKVRREEGRRCAEAERNGRGRRETEVERTE